MLPKSDLRSSSPSIQRPSGLAGQSLGQVRADAERDHIVTVLKLTEGRRGQAAEILGISRKTLWKKLKAFGIAPEFDVTKR